MRSILFVSWVKRTCLKLASNIRAPFSCDMYGTLISYSTNQFNSSCASCDSHCYQVVLKLVKTHQFKHWDVMCSLKYIQYMCSSLGQSFITAKLNESNRNYSRGFVFHSPFGDLVANVAMLYFKWALHRHIGHGLILSQKYFGAKNGCTRSPSAAIYSYHTSCHCIYELNFSYKKESYLIILYQ